MLDKLLGGDDKRSMSDIRAASTKTFRRQDSAEDAYISELVDHEQKKQAGTLTPADRDRLAKKKEYYLAAKGAHLNEWDAQRNGSSTSWGSRLTSPAAVVAYVMVILVALAILTKSFAFLPLLAMAGFLGVTAYFLPQIQNILTNGTPWIANPKGSSKARDSVLTGGYIAVLILLLAFGAPIIPLALASAKLIPRVLRPFNKESLGKFYGMATISGLVMLGMSFWSGGGGFNLPIPVIGPMISWMMSQHIPIPWLSTLWSGFGSNLGAAFAGLAEIKTLVIGKELAFGLVAGSTAHVLVVVAVGIALLALVALVAYKLFYEAPVELKEAYEADTQHEALKKLSAGQDIDPKLMNALIPTANNAANNNAVPPAVPPVPPVGGPPPLAPPLPPPPPPPPTTANAAAHAAHAAQLAQAQRGRQLAKLNALDAKDAARRRPPVPAHVLPGGHPPPPVGGPPAGGGMPPGPPMGGPPPGPPPFAPGHGLPPGVAMGVPVAQPPPPNNFVAGGGPPPMPSAPPPPVGQGGVGVGPPLGPPQPSAPPLPNAAAHNNADNPNIFVGGNMGGLGVPIVRSPIPGPASQNGSVPGPGDSSYGGMNC